MGARGGQANELIARLYTALLDDFVFLYDADGEASQVVVALLVHAGHFRGLTANQGAAR